MFWTRHEQCKHCIYEIGDVEVYGVDENGIELNQYVFDCDNGCKCDSDFYCEEFQER